MSEFGGLRKHEKTQYALYWQNDNCTSVQYGSVTSVMIGTLSSAHWQQASKLTTYWAQWVHCWWKIALYKLSIIIIIIIIISLNKGGNHKTFILRFISANFPLFCMTFRLRSR